MESPPARWLSSSWADIQSLRPRVSTTHRQDVGVISRDLPALDAASHDTASVIYHRDTRDC